MKTTTYVVLRPVSHDRTKYLPGETIELDEPTAAPLLGVESIAAVADPEAQAEPEVIDRALATLEPGNPEHFTQGGLPQVAALERAAGIEVTAAMRDAAWVRYQKARAVAGI